MEWIALSVSVLINVILITAFIFEHRNSNDNLFRKDAYISKTKSQLQQSVREQNYLKLELEKEKGKGAWALMYLAQVKSDKSLFRKKETVDYLFQMTLNGFPVGTPGVLKTDKFHETDKDEVNRQLENFAKPLMDLGQRIIVEKLKI